MTTISNAARLLQWNCRGLRANAAELNEHLRLLQYKPVVVLLQETKGKGPGIQGYRSYEVPSIRYASFTDPAATVVIQQTAIYVLKGTPHCQVPTASMCNDVQDVVAVRVSLGSRKLLVASTYVRPHVRGANFDWMRQLRTLYPRDQVVIGGDFNAFSTTWGYRVTNIRGRNLEEAADDADLILVNDLVYPTRLGQSSRQRDTIPDLTWATPSTVPGWQCESALWGSDHYPIWITLCASIRKTTKQVRYVDWRRFRELQDVEPIGLHNPCSDRLQYLINSILLAASGATTVVEGEEDSPAPDQHLVNLWRVRDDLQERYRMSGRTYEDLVRIRHQTARIRQYTKLLTRKRWEEYCESFSCRTGAQKL